MCTNYKVIAMHLPFIWLKFSVWWNKKEPLVWSDTHPFGWVIIAHPNVLSALCKETLIESTADVCIGSITFGITLWYHISLAVIYDGACCCSKALL